MKIITCASYYNTGSSAITDFFSEFDNIKSLGETEFRFLQDPDGVQALETNLIDHPHRHNSSHAIKRFIKASKFENGGILSKRYRRTFGDRYMKETMKYVEKITTLITNTHWRYDSIERGKLFYMLEALVFTLTYKLGRSKTISLMNLMGEKGYYTDISREDFYRLTREYVNNLFEPLLGDNDFLMVDQLVPATEFERYQNYADDLYLITVDRDPRDIYTLVATVPHFSVLPHNINDFCEWFKITRAHRKTDKENERRMVLNFEEIIYNYDECTDSLMNFVGVDKSHHVSPRTKLNPDVSIKNTKLWLKHPELKKEIACIESELSEYLYWRD